MGMFLSYIHIDDGMDLVFGFKNMAETEGRLNTRTGEYDFIGRSIPVYPQNDLDVPVGKQVLIKIKAPFGEKLSGSIMTKLFGSEKAFTMKLRIENNQGCVQFVNKGHQSRSKLLSIVGAKSPTKSPTKTQTSVTSVTISEEPSEEIPITSYDTDPLQDLKNITSDTPQVVTKPVLKLLPPTSPITQMAPKRVLSSIPEGDEER